MSETLHRVLDLIERRQIRVSAHGYDEMAEDGILVQDVLAHVMQAEVVEDYPDFHSGRLTS